MNPRRHSYTSSYFYIRQFDPIPMEHTLVLREGTKVVSGSIESKDIIFRVGELYIASYNISPLHLPAYTETKFHTFQHEDLAVLSAFMEDEGAAYAVAEKKHDNKIQQINKTIRDNATAAELAWGSFLGFCARNN
jgi:hypothetical protein